MSELQTNNDNKTSKSDSEKFKEKYLKEDGTSKLIERYKLKEPFHYTSGDSIIRNDSTLGKQYKFFRFSRKLYFSEKTSNCWNLTDEDKEMLTKIHSKLKFPQKGDKNYFNNNSRVVYYIQFFGKGNKIKDEDVRSDIKKEIYKYPCVHCGTKENIQVDHKNDLKNNPRVLIKKTQKLEDFQPLCAKCNSLKRSAKQNMLKTNKRYGAKKLDLDYPIDFIEGDETLNKEDPNWYIGTYWGDCKAFRQSLFKK